MVTLLHAVGWLGWLDALMMRLVNLPALPAGATTEAPADLPLVLLIGPGLYETAFGQTSPLRPEAVATLLHTLAAARPATVILDLDLSPGPADIPSDATRSQLDAALVALVRQGARVVVPLPMRVATPSLQDRKLAWLRMLCAHDGSGGGRLLIGLADVVTHQGMVIQYDSSRPSIGALAAPGGERLSLCSRVLDSGERFKALLVSTRFDSRAVFAGYTLQRLRPFNARLLTHAGTHIAIASALDRLPFDAARLAGATLVVGGAYDNGDRFVMPLDDPERRTEGAVVHALTFDSLQRPVTILSGFGAFALDVGLGIALGFAFGTTWGWYLNASRSARTIDKWGAQLAPRALLIGNLVLVAGLVWITVALAHAVLHPLNWWVNPGPVVLGVFAKFVIASRDGPDDAHRVAVPGSTAHRLQEWDQVLLYILVALALASLLLPH